jgi:cytochrome c peroxidase
VVNASGTRAVVANTFDDTLSVIDLEARRVVHQIELGPLAVPSPIDEGEMLFYDGRLSHDGWMSCHSCHTDGHTNGGLNDNFSDQSFGAPKRVLSLLGVADTAPYAWLGHVDSLEKQIDNSISNTMQGEVQLSQQQKQALIAYLRSLKVPPSVDRLRGAVDEAAVARGAQVFARRQCDQCHVPPSYTSADSYEVGLVDQRGNRKFNPPSLRGLSHRGPYFHDNAASTLDEVFRTYGHPHDSVYTEEEVRNLVAFLRSL